MNVIRTFLEEHPSIEIETTEEVMGGAWEALTQDRAELVIGGIEPIPNSKGIRTVPFTKVQRVLAVANSHPLAKFWGPISASELAKHRQIIIHDSSEIDIHRSSQTFSKHQRFYVDNMAQKIEAQRQGIGFGFLPYDSIKPYLAAGEMKILDLEGKPMGNESLIAWKIANQGKGLKKLRNMLVDSISAEPQASFEY